MKNLKFGGIVKASWKREGINLHQVSQAFTVTLGMDQERCHDIVNDLTKSTNLTATTLFSFQGPHEVYLSFEKQMKDSGIEVQVFERAPTRKEIMTARDSFSKKQQEQRCTLCHKISPIVARNSKGIYCKSCSPEKRLNPMIGSCRYCWEACDLNASKEQLCKKCTQKKNGIRDSLIRFM